MYPDSCSLEFKIKQYLMNQIYLEKTQILYIILLQIGKTNKITIYGMYLHEIKKFEVFDMHVPKAGLPMMTPTQGK